MQNMIGSFRHAFMQRGCLEKKNKTFQLTTFAVNCFLTTQTSVIVGTANTYSRSPLTNITIAVTRRFLTVTATYTASMHFAEFARGYLKWIRRIN